MSDVVPPGAVAGASPADFETLLVRGATVTLLLAGGWLALVALAGLVETLSHGRVRGLAGVGCPASWRPAVLLLLGAVLALPAGAAQAATTRLGAADGDGRWLPLPTRPVDADRVERHLVVPHDTLWGIARQQLGSATDDATLVTQVARLHRTNRLLIGAEPDLIHPGQRLVLPALPREGDRR